MERKFIQLLFIVGLILKSTFIAFAQLSDFHVVLPKTHTSVQDAIFSPPTVEDSLGGRFMLVNQAGKLRLYETNSQLLLLEYECAENSYFKMEFSGDAKFISYYSADSLVMYDIN
jgi:streptomycin 6-kinase